MLGEQLVGAGLLHPEKLAEAKLHQELTGKDLVEALLTLNMVPERDLLRVLAQLHQLQYLTTEKIVQLKVADELLDQVKVRVAESLTVMPIRRNPDGTLWVLGAGPLADEGEERLKGEGGAKKVNVILARSASIRAAIRRHYYRDPHAFSTVEERAIGPALTEPSLVVAVNLEDFTQTPEVAHREITDPAVSVVTAMAGPAGRGMAEGALTAMVQLGQGMAEGSVTTVVPLGRGLAEGSLTAMVPLGSSLADATDPGRRATESYRAAPEPEGEVTRKVKSAIGEIHQVLERENQRLRVALSLFEAIGQLHKLEDVARELLVAMLDLFPADGAAFALTGEGSRPLMLETLRRDGGAAFQVPGALLAAAAEARQPLVTGNVTVDSRLTGEGSLLTRGVKSLMVSPIRSGDGRAMGALYVEARDLSAFSSDSAELLRVVSQVAGAALDNVNQLLRLEHQARARATHERFLSIPRALAASLASPAFDLKPRAVEGTFLYLRLMPPLRARSGEPPGPLFQKLEAHVDAVSARIHAHGGLVESTSRGEIGALFGGPESHDAHVENAIVAALEVFALVDDGRTLPVAAGVASGSMLAGGAGKAGQLQYAVLGEPAELARALASVAPSMELHASESVEQQSESFHRWEPLKAGVAVSGELRPAFKLLWR